VEDEGGHDAQRDAVDALRAEEHVVDDPRDRVAPVGEDVEARDAEEVGPEIAVDQHQHGNDRQRRPDAPPGSLQDEQEREAADDEFRQVGAAGSQADVVELHEDEDGDQAGHEGEEDVEIGHVVQPVVGCRAFTGDRHEHPDPVEEKQRDDGAEDPQQEEPPEYQLRVEILEPGADVEVGIAQPGHVEDETDHRGVNREIDEGGQAQGQVLPLLEVQDEREGGRGEHGRGAEGQGQDLAEDGRVEHGRHGGVEDIVEEVLGPLEVHLFLHGIDEKHERQDEGEVEGPVSPLLQDTEPCRVDMEDRQDDGHGEDELRGDAREAAKAHLGVVLRDLIRVLLDLGGRDDPFFLLCHVVHPRRYSHQAQEVRSSSVQAETLSTDIVTGPSPARAGRNTSLPLTARVPPQASVT